jgi:hypothetical protein
MALLDSEHAWMLCLKKAADVSWKDLTAWEKKFVEDLLARFEIYGRNTKVSPKEWSVITDISDKIIP